MILESIAKRDFSNESVVNIFLRIVRAVSVRLRGRIFGCFRVFSPGSSKRFAIGFRPKFINSRGIFLENNVSFGDLCRLECYSNDAFPIGTCAKLTIGENSSFGDLVHIGVLNGISIGKNVLCASKVLIIDHDHGRCGEELKALANIPPRSRELTSKGKIRIGNNVWLGESVVILAGSNIDDGSVVAANSTVRGYVPASTVFTTKGKTDL
jgi:acetyltransferase-like isoleucine patch superfamily enzyme